MKSIVNKDNKLFYFCYLLILVGQMLSNVIFLHDFLDYIDYVAIFLLIVFIIRQSGKFDIKSVIKIVICSLIVCIVSVVSGDKKLLKLILFIIAIKDVSFDEFIKKDFLFKFVLMILVLFLFAMGFTNPTNAYRADGIIRYSMGFQHPNNFSVYTLSLCFDCIYVYKNKKNLFQYILIFISFIANYYLADSRTGVFILFFVLLYLFIPKKLIIKIMENKIVKLFITNLFVILFILSLFCTVNYVGKRNEFIYQIDAITSRRVFLANQYLKKYPAVSLFGHNMIETSRYIDLEINPHYLPLDNAYMYILLRFGVLVVALLIYLYFVTIKCAYKMKNYTLIFVLTLWTTYAVMEATYISIDYNPFLLAFSYAFYVNRNHKKDINLLISNSY